MCETAITTPAAGGESSINLWDSLKGIIVFLGVYLFFIGWVYLAHYFRQFGFMPLSIKIEVHDYYVYGFYAIQRSWALITILAIFFIICIIQIYSNRKQKDKYAALLVTSVVVFILSFFAAQSAATTRASKISKGTADEQIPSLYISFKKDYLEKLTTTVQVGSSDSLTSIGLKASDRSRVDNIANLFYAMKKEKLVEIFENDDQLFAFCNTDMSGVESHPRVLVYSFRKEDIEFYSNEIFHQ